ncbi:phosphoribosylanthranilate isomerase [Anaerovirgula multivorans]|uniref:N-(5'-phosphoribosyl)anthranilate isomerase n=1 Tax=Anaerovirgula multivorans TaxID=312168 RepID=A0A239HJF2_9FIRM|nr:phosphoribosylanthranilate isomerase [Anaerovirgula multivorans]SNS81529.1 phosphoribosylanthranilate isomerase [Anaerovirgula multivorans]
MTRIKICGLTREEDIAYVNELKPDYVGFVFATSKRQITPKKAIKLIEKLDRRIKKVGVFVNPSMEEARRIAEACDLDVLQFHGEEKPEDIIGLPRETWKSFRIKNQESFQELEAYSVGGYLLDTYVKGQQGGTGKAFDWNIDSDINKNKMIILAGGLSSENVEEAVEKMKPHVVDVSSGVETDGCKDFEKIKKFIEKVRGSHDS